MSGPTPIIVSRSGIWTPWSPCYLHPSQREPNLKDTYETSKGNFDNNYLIIIWMNQEHRQYTVYLSIIALIPPSSVYRELYA